MAVETKLNLQTTSNFGKMNITKENFDKLKQLDRIEFRQRVLLIKEMGKLNAKKYFLISILLAFFTVVIAIVAVPIFIIVSIYFVIKAIVIDKEYSKLEEEYFTEEIKIKK